MKCKNCGAQINKGVEVCPVCKQKVQKMSTGLILAISMAAVLVVAVVLAAVLLLGDDNKAPDPENPTNQGNTTASGQQVTNPGSEPGTDTDTQPVERPEDSYSADASTVADAKMQQVVATNGDAQLTNELLSYYYWFGYSSFVNYHGEYITQFLNPSQTHDTQYYDDGETTWQAFFLDMALQNFRYYSAMCADAKANGYKLDEGLETYLADMDATLAQMATQYNYASGEDYLRACFGAKSTVEGYKTFMREYLTSMNYASYLQQNLAFTEDEVQAYYDEHKTTYEENGIKQDGTCLTTVRHILIAPTDTEDQADWLEAEQTAKDIYDTWQNNPTEDYFAQLATTFSADTGSTANGGKYENIYPGEMVEAFNDWCFDPAREAGDHAIVETPYGYHIMYFCERGMEFWYYAAATDLMNETYAELETNIVEKTELVVDYEKIVLVDPVGMFG